MKIVKPYTEDQSDKKTQVRQMFDKIAPRYDFLNHFLSLGIDRIWRRKAIREIKKSGPATLLDVATGTGDLAILAAWKIEGIKVTGIDITAGMLDIARKKSNKSGLDDQLDFLLADAENLPFQENTFDALTVAFGIRNFGDLRKGLAEMLRVMVPGGKLAILEFGKPRVFPLKQGYHFYFKRILPFVGKITSKDPKAYTYLYESVQAFPDGKAMVDLLQEIGFNAVEYKSLTFGICAMYTATK